MTFPFFNPRILNWLASGKWAADTRAGPMTAVISKDLPQLPDIGPKRSYLTNRASSIEPFGKAPLALVRLRRPAGYVVGSCITQHTVQCILFADVLRIPANNNDHFGFVIACVILLGDSGENRRSRPGIGQGCRWFHEQGWEIWDGEFHFVGVRDILSTRNQNKIPSC